MTARATALLALLVLAGCDAQPDATPAASPADPPAIPAAITPAPVADRSPDAAQRLVTRYYAAIAAGDFASANAAWGKRGMPGLDRTAFARGLRDVETLEAEILSVGRAEPAAGSVYLELMVRLAGRRDNGAPIRVEGPVVLRRVNDVDGSTAAERSWHIESAPSLAP